MFISDEKDLNNYGIPTTQGCNFAVYPTDNRSILASAYSSSGNAYLVLTLPNGFRFTGYSMTLKNDLSGTVVGKTFSRSNECISMRQGVTMTTPKTNTYRTHH